jgi:hypothetical protein
MSCSIISTSTRKLLFHNKVQQSRLNLIKIYSRSRWRNRSADKITIIRTSKITQLGVLRSSHSSKTKSRQVKKTTKDSNFFGFLINDASKNKVKQNLKQSKGCACETPLAEVFFFPGSGTRKFVACCGTVDVNHRPVGNPKRKV